MGLVPLEDLDQSIAARASSAVLQKLFLELERLASVQEVTQTWFEDTLEIYKFMTDVEIGFGHARAYALAIIKQNWDNLPIEVRKRYGFSFMTFAKLVTGKDDSTIHNYIRTAEVWFLTKVKPNHQIRVVDRDEFGKPKDTSHYVEFSPYQVDMSKLLALNAKAAKGQVTEREWEVLVDDMYSCTDLHTVMRGDVSHEEPASYWYCEGPYLFYKQNHVRIKVAELNFEEYESDEEVKKAVNKLISILSIKLDEHYLFQEFKQGYYAAL